MRQSAGVILVFLGLGTAATKLSHPAPPPIQFNDGRTPAGSLTDGTESVSLVAESGEWRPYGPEGRGIQILAFGETGKALEDPGPMLRVPLGTHVVARIENRTGAELVVRGLSARRRMPLDSLVIAPNASGTARFVADAPGTYYYWGATHGESFGTRWRDDEHLNGAFIVDPPGAAAGRDRVFVIERESQTSDSNPRDVDGIYTINGRPWPFTERLTYNMGDSIRWRVINASDEPHPLHLHGFFFRINAHGDLARDTVYWSDQQREEVTEDLHAGTTMDVAWLADRPGGWIFHCHINFHVVDNPSLPPAVEPPDQRLQHELNGYPPGRTDGGSREGMDMGGLVLGIRIRAPAGWHPYQGERRTVRLVVESGASLGDTTGQFEYVVDAGHGDIDSSAVLGPAIILHRGEPTRIWIVNRSAQATQIHWHGLEVESGVDGVVGMSGMPGAMEPPVEPGDSFPVLVTPRRPGSYMYHTHLNAMYQQMRGLYGPLIVLDSGAAWNPDRDRVFIIGNRPDGTVMLNAGDTSTPIQLRAHVPYRFRLMNITVGNPLIRYELVRTSGPSTGSDLQWIPIAKDAYPVNAARRVRVDARQPVSIGETYDFLVAEADSGRAALEVRAANGRLLSRQDVVFAR